MPTSPENSTPIPKLERGRCVIGILTPHILLVTGGEGSKAVTILQGLVEPSEVLKETGESLLAEDRMRISLLASS